VLFFCTHDCQILFIVMVAKICPICSHSFAVLPSRSKKQVCCSQACGRLNRISKVFSKSCKGCGKSFNIPSSRSTIVFCSSECRKQYKRINVICIECSKAYSLTRSKYETIMGKSGLFCCSKHCAYKNMPSRGGGYNRCCKSCGIEFSTYTPNKYTCSESCSKSWRIEKSKSKRVVCICDNCKKTFYRTPSAVWWANERGHEKVFCSTECDRQYKVGENHPVWVKDRTKLKNKNNTFRQSREAIAWRDSVFVRDEYTCQDCHKAGYVEAHHIVPLRDSDMLSLDVSNGITLCRDCHIKTFRKELYFVEKYKKIVEEKCVTQQKH